MRHRHLEANHQRPSTLEHEVVHAPSLPDQSATWPPVCLRSVRNSEVFQQFVELRLDVTDHFIGDDGDSHRLHAAQPPQAARGAPSAPSEERHEIAAQQPPWAARGAPGAPSLCGAI